MFNPVQLVLGDFDATRSTTLLAESGHTEFPAGSCRSPQQRMVKKRYPPDDPEPLSEEEFSCKFTLWVIATKLVVKLW